MGNSKKPHQEDQDNDGIPDNRQSQLHSGHDIDGDGVPEGEADLQSNPIIINPNR